MERDSKELYQIVKAWFEEDGWPIYELKNQVFGVRFRGQRGSWTCMVSVTDQGIFRMFSYLPSTGPERVAALEKTTTLCNYGLFIGNFEVDTDGEVRFKTSLAIRELDDAAVRQVVKDLAYANVVAMDRYYNALTMVASTDIDPATVIRAADERSIAIAIEPELAVVQEAEEPDEAEPVMIGVVPEK